MPSLLLARSLAARNLNDEADGVMRVLSSFIHSSRHRIKIHCTRPRSLRSFV